MTSSVPANNGSRDTTRILLSAQTEHGVICNCKAQSAQVLSLDRRPVLYCRKCHEAIGAWSLNPTKIYRKISAFQTGPVVPENGGTKHSTSSIDEVMGKTVDSLILLPSLAPFQSKHRFFAQTRRMLVQFGAVRTE